LEAAGELSEMQPTVPQSPDEPAGLTPGWLAREVEQELPALRLHSTEVQLARGRSPADASPPGVAARLDEHANRWRGARAVALRREPIPAAYRLFFRHIGLDPDAVRTPIEQVALGRMFRGGFPSEGLLADVLLIALVDTYVPVWALDRRFLDGPLGIRPSREGEPFGRFADARAMPGGRLVVADASAALAILFGELAAGHEPRADTNSLTLFAVQVAGVPTLYVEEALWSGRTALEAA
jgi:DNA/RNA-binding domain of Phe-tRNA-synthetase-like protein